MKNLYRLDIGSIRLSNDFYDLHMLLRTYALFRKTFNYRDNTPFEGHGGIIETGCFSPNKAKINGGSRRHSTSQNMWLAEICCMMRDLN